MIIKILLDVSTYNWLMKWLNLPQALCLKIIKIPNSICIHISHMTKWAVFQNSLMTLLCWAKCAVALYSQVLFIGNVTYLKQFFNH